MKRRLQLICQDTSSAPNSLSSIFIAICILKYALSGASGATSIDGGRPENFQQAGCWLPLCNAPGGILADLVAFQGQHMVLTSSSSFVSKIWHVDIKDICHIGILCSLYMFSLPSHPWYSRPPSSTRVSFLSRFIHWMNPKYDIMRTKNICHIGMTCILNQRNTDIWDTLH